MFVALLQACTTPVECKCVFIAFIEFGSHQYIFIHTYIFNNPRSRMTIQDAKTVSDEIFERFISFVRGYKFTVFVFLAKKANHAETTIELYLRLIWSPMCNPR